MDAEVEDPTPLPPPWEAPGFPCLEPGASKKPNPPPRHRRALAWLEPAEKGAEHSQSCTLSRGGRRKASCVFKDWRIINSLFTVDIRRSLGVQRSLGRGGTGVHRHHGFLPSAVPG